MLLEGKAGVVTGSAMGIGRAVAIALAEEGADVACLDIDGPANAATAAAIRALGRRALALDCDVADRFAVRRAFAQIADAFGRLDVLVNNAAIYIDTSLLNGTYDSQTGWYERSMDICAMGSYYCAMAATPLLRASGGGNIINMITEHIKPGHMYSGPGATGYDHAKWVQWRQTESWAIELQPVGIRVNGLCFGATDTPMLRAVSVAAAERGMRPEDVALAVLNVIRQGPDGPVGRTWLFGATGTSNGRAEAEALLHAQ